MSASTHRRQAPVLRPAASAEPLTQGRELDGEQHLGPGEVEGPAHVVDLEAVQVHDGHVAHHPREDDDVSPAREGLDARERGEAVGHEQDGVDDRGREGGVDPAGGKHHLRQEQARQQAERVLQVLAVQHGEDDAQGVRRQQREQVAQAGGVLAQAGGQAINRGGDTGRQRERGDRCGEAIDRCDEISRVRGQPRHVLLEKHTQRGGADVRADSI